MYYNFRVVFTFLISFFLFSCGSDSVPVSPTRTGEGLATYSPVSFHLQTIEGSFEIRLAEVEAPNDEAARRRTRAALAALLEEAGANLELIETGTGEDRYGRHVGHAEFDREAGRVWIQGELVSAGWLMAAGRADSRARIGRLLELEERARAMRSGLWASGELVVRDPDPNGLAQHLDSYQIVRGRVIDTGAARNGRVYLNFGLDWRTDFTVSISPAHLERFQEAGLDPMALAGHEVRVRGWLYRENGPMIALDHPEAIEQFD